MEQRRFHRIPERIHRLEELAYNLWWSWDFSSRRLFKALDYRLWKLTQHNPVRQLIEIPQDRLEEAARDPQFLRLYDDVLVGFERGISRRGKWFEREFAGFSGLSIAYFSAEFGLHNSLPIYSGGLGVLSGDHCKESSDLGIPLTGIGFVYPQGYFRQRLRADGWQEDIYEVLKREEAPIEMAGRNGDGGRCTVVFEHNSSRLSVYVWKVNVGNVPLYLMDTDVEENEPWDRELSARLYGGDKEHRIRQEIVLGICGTRVLRQLGIAPAVWHANEGHTAFMVLERLRELVQQGLSFEEAAEQVRTTTVFTTHTPVPAGHDAFPFHMIEKHFAGYWDQLGLTREQFFDLGRHEDLFNMTVLALRMSGGRNGVSALHGRVTRGMWRGLWADRAPDEVPIAHVTNGVHSRTWIASEMKQLFVRYLGPEWTEYHDDPRLWDRIHGIPDEEFWNVRLELKRKLLATIRERARKRWTEDRVDARQITAMGTLLDPEALTIGFARRFTGYKRALLFFQNLERTRALLLDRFRPVQIVFAGKAHPADEHGKHLIYQIYSLAADPTFAGHVAFVEDYDIHLARFMTQGVDVWLNTPRPPLEASGTSGQKSAMNGVINFSVLDGWWCESYNKANGWAIGEPPDGLDPRQDDAADSASLYDVLEHQIIPMYYDRDERGLPHRWIQTSKESIRSVLPRFCSRRMMKQYATDFYIPAARRGGASSWNR